MSISRVQFDEATASADGVVDRIQFLGALLGMATGMEPIATGSSAA